MPLVSLDHLKAQLGFTDDIGDADDALLEAKLAAAQAHIERGLGYEIASRFGIAPPDLIEAVLQLAAHWYENREAGSDARREIPFGVSDIIMARKDWSF